MHIITEDWPLTEDEKMFKAGERLLEVSYETTQTLCTKLCVKVS